MVFGFFYTKNKIAKIHSRCKDPIEEIAVGYSIVREGVARYAKESGLSESEIIEDLNKVDYISLIKKVKIGD